MTSSSVSNNAAPYLENPALPLDSDDLERQQAGNVPQKVSEVAARILSAEEQSVVLYPPRDYELFVAHKTVRERYELTGSLAPTEDQIMEEVISRRKCCSCTGKVLRAAGTIGLGSSIYFFVKPSLVLAGVTVALSSAALCCMSFLFNGIGQRGDYEEPIC